jgi:hypothetical protein
MLCLARSENWIFIFASEVESVSLQNRKDGVTDPIPSGSDHTSLLGPLDP